jgi:hypothetical protein
MSVEAMRLKLPMIRWGGPRFTQDAGGDAMWTGTTFGEDVSPGMAAAFSVTGGGTTLNFNASALFGWLPLPLTFETRYGWARREFTGLTPGTTFGWRTNQGWVVNQEPQNTVFSVQTIGVTSPTFVIPEGVTGVFAPRAYYFTTEVPPSGIVAIKVLAQAVPSFNANWNLGPITFGEVGAGPRQYTLLCPFPPEDFRSYSEPSPDYTELAYPSGFRDAWNLGNYRKLDFTPRAIPWYGRDVSDDTWWGWDGEGGWRAFFQDAIDGAEFDFYPDQTNDAVLYTCHLEAPAEAKMDVDWIWHNKGRCTIRTADGTAIAGY